jgi:hypothetical protein
MMLETRASAQSLAAALPGMGKAAASDAQTFQ